jgi:hypothetical protein
MEFKELEIIKIETEDRFFVTDQGELGIEMQITVLPSGSVIE